MYLVAHNGAHIWGGAERAVTLILAGLQGRGHRVRLFCADPLVAGRAEGLGVPAELATLGGDAAVHHAARFALALRRHRPDALMIGTYKKLFLASMGARLARVPRVVARVGLETDTLRNAKYRVALPRWVDAVVVNASRMAPTFVNAGLKDVRVIPNAAEVPVRRQPPGALRAALGIPADAPVVGAVARLARQKRFDRLLRAFATLASDTHLVLAGDGEERETLQALAVELGIADRAHFLGFRDDTGDVLGALDVFVLSSDREGMSNAMIEALAAGVPVVSTPVSGTEDALAAAPGEIAPGVILPGFGEGELAEALRGVLADADRRVAMAEAARERARARFAWDAVLAEWERVLAPTVARGRGR
ncbi:MAG TPA: glycosyltransferase [Longimicrobium sp.]|nr:glycosyltransferase [Longimicrobium sp.]